jgi:hypothetical protein
MIRHLYACMTMVAMLLVGCDHPLDMPVPRCRLTVLAGQGGDIVTPSISPAMVEKGASIPLAAVPRAGFSFLKWTSAAECAPVSYQNAAGAMAGPVMGDDTLTALFLHKPTALAPVDLLPVGRLERGCSYRYFEGSWTTLPNFAALTPRESDSCGSLDLAAIAHAQNRFAVEFYGFIDIPFDGEYLFYVNSSGGAALYINDSLIVQNGGMHDGPVEASGAAPLAPGKYLLTFRYFNATSPPICTVSYACTAIGIDKQPIQGSILSRPYTGPVSKIIITNPSGGESYRLGDTLPVRWIYRHFDHMVYCELSVDDGKSFPYMLSVRAYGHTDSVGTMKWKIPFADSFVTTKARIKVRDYPPGVNECVSNAFSIVNN